MKRIRDFKVATDATSARELSRQLRELEAATADAFAVVDRAAMRRLVVKQRITNSNEETLAPGQSIGLISAVTRLQLLPPSAADAGKFLVVCQFPGVAVTTTIYAPAGSYINGAATYVLPTNGRAYVFFCDGVDYWTDQ